MSNQFDRLLDTLADEAPIYGLLDDDDLEAHKRRLPGRRKARKQSGSRPTRKRRS